MILQGLNSSTWCGPLIFQHLLFQYSIDITNHPWPEIHFRSGTRSYARSFVLTVSHWRKKQLRHMGNGKHGWHHAWHKILNTLMQKHHKDNLTYPASKLEKNQFFLQSIFFQDFDISYLSGSLQPLAATRSHSQYWQPPTATRSPSQPLAATRSHSTPLAATRVAASGCKWRSKRVAASGRKWPLQASGRKWPQVAAPDSSQRVAASGRKAPLQPVPSEWPQVAAFCDFNFHPQSNLSGSIYTLYLYIYICEIHKPCVEAAMACWWT